MRKGTRRMRRVNVLLLMMLSIAGLSCAAASCEAGMLQYSVSGVAQAPEDTLGGSDFLFKVEDSKTTGVLNLSDFKFYALASDDSKSGTLTITWDSTLNPSSYYFAPLDNPYDITNATIGGFIYTGTADIEKYLVKAGTNYSVWDYMDGFNLAFYDVDGSVGGPPWEPPATGNGGARGISHINFFGSEISMQPVPEPSSLLLFGIGAVVAGGIARRRRQQGE